MQGGQNASSQGDLRLLLSVAQQLREPLTVIARQAELGLMTPDKPATEELTAVGIQTSLAMHLVDSYLLGLQLLAEQETLDLEPVSVASTLVDTSHELSKYAKQYGVRLELSVAGRYEPVMAHGKGLRAALLSMGYALIASGAAQADAKTRQLTIATHRTAQGIVAGMYGQYDALTAQSWRQAMQLYGQAAQPFAALSSGSGAGVFVADALSRAMDSHLRIGRYAHQTGLAMTLTPSQQLQLV